MATVNRESLREEAERKKAEFQLITKNKKIDSETSMLFQSMLMLINLLICQMISLTLRAMESEAKASRPRSRIGHAVDTEMRRQVIWKIVHTKKY